MFCSICLTFYCWNTCFVSKYLMIKLLWNTCIKTPLIPKKLQWAQTIWPCYNSNFLSAERRDTMSYCPCFIWFWLGIRAMFLILLKAYWNQTKDLKVKNRKRVLISFIHPSLFVSFCIVLWWIRGTGQQMFHICYRFDGLWKKRIWGIF